MFLLYTWQKEVEQKAFGGRKIAVLVAKSDIKPGSRVQDKDLKAWEVPEVYLHPETIRVDQQNLVLGRPVERLVRQDQPLQWTDFPSSDRERSGGAVPKGLRGTAIQVSEYLGKSGLVGPGERVDVLGTFGGSDLRGSMTVTLLQNVLLIDINANVAVLALELEDAEMLTFAAAHGQVSLLLRNAEDLDVRKDIPPKSFRSLIDKIKALETISSDQAGANAAAVLKGLEAARAATKAKPLK